MTTYIIVWRKSIFFLYIMTSTLEYCVVYFVSDRILLKEPVQAKLCHRVNNEYFYWMGIVFAQMKIGDTDYYPYMTVSPPTDSMYAAIPLNETLIVKPIPRHLEEVYGDNGQIKRVHIEKCYGDEFVTYIYSLLNPKVVSAIYFEWENGNKIMGTLEDEINLSIFFSTIEPINKIITINPSVVNSYAKTSFSRQTVIADVLYQFYKGSPLENHIHRIYGMDFITNPSKELRLMQHSQSYVVTKSSLFRPLNRILDYNLAFLRFDDLIYGIILAALSLHAVDIIHTSLSINNISIIPYNSNLDATIYGWPVIVKQAIKKKNTYILHAYDFSNAFLKVEEDHMDEFINDYDPNILGKLKLFKYDLTTSLLDQKFYICEIMDLLISLLSLKKMSMNVDLSNLSSKKTTKKINVNSLPPHKKLAKDIDEAISVLENMLDEPTQHKRSPLLNVLELMYKKKFNRHVSNFII